MSKLPRFKLPHFPKKVLVVVGSCVILIGLSIAGVYAQRLSDSNEQALQKNILLTEELAATKTNFERVSAELASLSAEDQVVKNKELAAEISSIQAAYKESVALYELMLDLRGDGVNTTAFEASFAKILSLLANRKLSDALLDLEKLQAALDKSKQDQTAKTEVVPANVTANNTPPSSGSSRQAVTTEFGQYVVDMVVGDLNSTRVQVETASEGTCGDNCPVASLGDFVGRSGGYAGINGPYFCPASYPSCVGKTNSFDTLIMNSKKVFFNSDNNVFSTVPAFVFSGNSGRIMKSAEVGRDTVVDSVIAAQPALVWGGQVTFGGDGDPKKGSRGPRSFIAVKGNTVIIGVVRGATVAEAAHVLKAMGVDHALNLDSGGSTALMANGKYLAGPGRATPFGIVLVRK